MSLQTMQTHKNVQKLQHLKPFCPLTPLTASGLGVAVHTKISILQEQIAAISSGAASQ